MISGVSQVVMAVDDQERAKRFRTERIGFELLADETFGDERWIELAPPDRRLRLVLSQRGEGETRPEARPEHPHSPVFFTCRDLRATYRELTERGVRFAQRPTEMHFGWWSMFEDDEGTRYALGQSASEEP